MEVVPVVTERSAKHALDLGVFTGADCVIELTTQIPIFRPSFRKSLSEMEIIEELVEEMLQAGIVRNSTSPYNNPIMVIPKPDGSHRIVHDFRALNEIMYPIQFAVPRVQDIFQKFQGKKYFSKIDFIKGFHQNPIEESCKKYLSFSTMKRKCEYNYLPQGVKIGPAWFSLTVGMAIISIQNFTTHYFDDVYIFSYSIEEHIEHIVITMEKLKDAGFKISPKKSLFCVTEIGVLGFLITGEEVKIDPKKIEAIIKRQPPLSSKGVLSSLGTFGYFRKHKRLRKIPSTITNSDKRVHLGRTPKNCIQILY